MEKKKELTGVFAKAYDNLRKGDAAQAKDTIIKRCKWSHQQWSQKMSGERALQEYSSKRINEIMIVESVFKGYNINAFTGEQIYDDNTYKNRTATSSAQGSGVAV